MAFELIKPRTTVLDVGCSSGNFGEALIHFKKCTVDGVEPNRADASLAKQKLRSVHTSNVEDVLGDLIKSKATYDHVVFLDVIEHLYKPSALLKEIRKILEPKGTIVFSLPNMGHQSVRIMLLTGDFEYGKTGILDNTHLHFYTEKELRRVFDEAGFSVKSLDSVVVAYDEELLRSELSKVGVKEADKNLIRVLTKNNAHTYQFVGDAVPRANVKVNKGNRKFQSPAPKDTIREAYDKKIMERELFFKHEIDKRNNALKEKNKIIQDKDLLISKMNKKKNILNRLRNIKP
ncbi:MAG: class I SAM-dependent methyltransferase [bacterium]|nr:class I SAM-dependent methyltransferase [bacterium]